MVMRVYTFSTGGCRDAIYLDRVISESKFKYCNN